MLSYFTSVRDGVMNFGPHGRYKAMSIPSNINLYQILLYVEIRLCIYDCDENYEIMFTLIYLHNMELFIWVSMSLWNNEVIQEIYQHVIFIN